ncbi:MAG: NmrA family NAD(P)-binding protein [Bacteroidales bacterium]
MENKILVLSATGNVGKPLVDMLLKNFVDVKAASRSGKSITFSIRTAEGVCFDFSKPETYENAFEGVNSVYMMLPADLSRNAKVLIPLIDIAVKRDIKIVLQSSIHALIDAHDPYVAVENYLKKSTEKYVILRPTWFMDNFHIFWADDIKSKVFNLPVKDGKTAFVDIRDLVYSAAKALYKDNYNGKEYNITGEVALSYKEAISIIGEKLGSEIHFNSVSEADYIKQMTDAGMPEQAARFFTSALAEVDKGVLADVYDGVRQITGNTPRTLEVYIHEHRRKFY